MPGHHTHDKIGVIITPVIAAVSIYTQQHVMTTIMVSASFLCATYMFSPDLDLNSRIYRRWGLLRWIWLPYQHCIKHRSWLSHSGPISATIRLLYLCVFLLPFAWLAHFDLLTLLPYCGMIWLSVSLSDTAHLIADRIWRD